MPRAKKTQKLPETKHLAHELLADYLQTASSTSCCTKQLFNGALFHAFKGKSINSHRKARPSVALIWSVKLFSWAFPPYETVIFVKIIFLCAKKATWLCTLWVLKALKLYEVRLLQKPWAAQTSLEKLLSQVSASLSQEWKQIIICTVNAQNRWKVFFFKLCSLKTWVSSCP